MSKKVIVLGAVVAILLVTCSGLLLATICSGLAMTSPSSAPDIDDATRAPAGAVEQAEEIASPEDVEQPVLDSRPAPAPAETVEEPAAEGTIPSF